jgi:predicted amidohydrolase
MRLGLAQLNTLVGDLAGNRRKIIDAYTALVAQGAELVVFPEARRLRLSAARPAVQAALRARRGRIARRDRRRRGRRARRHRHR